MSNSHDPSFRRHLPLILVWVISSAYLIFKADEGWIPHDEGLLAQTAERVMEGELPHRDFDDPYTGGLAMLHALAFRLLGVDLYSMRLVLCAFAVSTIPVIYSIAVRAVTPVIAGLVTLSAVVWSVPNYFAPLPSWYNLFFAIHGMWFLLRFIETNRLRWLAMAGVAGGVSILFKIVGVYYVAGVCLYLLYCEQELTRSAIAVDASGRPRGSALERLLYPMFLSLAVGIFVGAVAMLIRQRLTPMDGIHFLVPSLVLAIVVWVNEYKLRGGSGKERWKQIFSTYGLFVTGVALPLLAFIVPYAISGSLYELYYGVLILPQKRLQAAAYSLPPLSTLVAIFPLAMVLLVRAKSESVWRGPIFVSVAAIACFLMIVIAGTPSGYSAIWYSARPIVPLVTLIGSWMLVTRSDLTSVQRQTLFVVLAITSTVSLLQYPYSFGVYFCYVAPLVLLAASHVATLMPHSLRYLKLGTLVVYLVFAVVWLNRGYVRSIGVSYVHIDETATMKSPRASLTVPAIESRLYANVVDEISRHAKPGSFIYATSDCPEIYFLSDCRNPTRTFYDFFDSDFESDPVGRVERLVKMLNAQEINLVVIRWMGEFSGPPNEEFLLQLHSHFPEGKHFWLYPERAVMATPTFSVIWRE